MSWNARSPLKRAPTAFTSNQFSKQHCWSVILDKNEAANVFTTNTSFQIDTGQITSVLKTAALRPLILIIKRYVITF